MNGELDRNCLVRGAEQVRGWRQTLGSCQHTGGIESPVPGCQHQGREEVETEWGWAPSPGRANTSRQGDEEGELVRGTEKEQPASRTRAHRVGTREPREEGISVRRTSCVPSH